MSLKSERISDALIEQISYILEYDKFILCFCVALYSKNCIVYAKHLDIICRTA